MFLICQENFAKRLTLPKWPLNHVRYASLNLEFHRCIGDIGKSHFRLQSWAIKSALHFIRNKWNELRTLANNLQSCTTIHCHGNILKIIFNALSLTTGFYRELISTKTWLPSSKWMEQYRWLVRFCGEFCEKAHPICWCESYENIVIDYCCDVIVQSVVKSCNCIYVSAGKNRCTGGNGAKTFVMNKCTN